MFSCTSLSKAFQWPFQALTFNASATNCSGLEQAAVVIPSELVVEWSIYRKWAGPRNVQYLDLNRWDGVRVGLGPGYGIVSGNTAWVQRG